jgi:pectate lyase
VSRGNSFGGASADAPEGTFTEAPYQYTLVDTAQVEAAATAGAGQTLTF